MILKTKQNFRWICQLGKKKSMLRAPGRHIWKISQNLVKRKQRDVKWDSVVSSIIHLIWVVEGVNIGKGGKGIIWRDNGKDFSVLVTDQYEYLERTINPRQLQ